jgi:hypothetical protein
MSTKSKDNADSSGRDQAHLGTPICHPKALS